MIAGVQPFKALTPYLSMEKTKKAEYTVPAGFDPTAQDLVENFLIIHPTQRLGDAARGGPEPIRAHKFFESVDWSHIWALNPPPLEAGLVKKEPPTPRSRRSRSKTPITVGDNSCSSDTGDEGGRRGEAWTALVRDLSEDEMEDGRSSYNCARSDAYSLGGRSEGTIGNRGSGRGEEGHNHKGTPPMHIFPKRDDSVSVERSYHSVRGGSRNEPGSPSQSGLSAPQTSPERGHSYEATRTPTSSQTRDQVRAWDAYYSGRPTSLPRDEETRLSVFEEINESRANSGSPVSSVATSSTGQSDSQAIWYVSSIA